MIINHKMTLLQVDSLSVRFVPSKAIECECVYIGDDDFEVCMLMKSQRLAHP